MANRPGAAFNSMLIASAALLIASVAGQVAGVYNGSGELSVFAAGAFVGGMLRLAWQANRPWWHAATQADIGPLPADAEPKIAERNTQLMAIGYAWGAASLFSVYLGTPLRWQHGWQYGTAMALIAMCLFLLARVIPANWTPRWRASLTWATLLHGWAATGAVIWLIASAKLFSVKPDWAANIVFASGALIVSGIGAMWLRSARILRARDGT
jgi:hypothetical protein